jgi:2-(1,2-epoxy-1,2-dihydrophenyl)acetyl-CoA isomerase
MALIDITRADRIALITLNRPERKNAINDEMVMAIADAFEALADDTDTRVLLLTAKGPDFSAGGDLANLAEWLSPDPDERSAKFRASVLSLSKPLALAMQRVPQPIVAAVRGHVIGVALQMVIIADLVIASDTARFSLPQLNLAHTPDHGESWSLPRKIGMARAMQMTLLAERIDAQTAERYNLVNWVVPDAELDEQAVAIASKIAASPPIAARAAKALLLGSEPLTLADAIDREAYSIAQAVRTDDFVEAITAFGEKRSPVFSGG